MSEWQPIETAPKDGSRLLAYSKGWDHEQKDQEIAWWNESSGLFRWQSGTIVKPTHWMPLPSPPEA